jgi:hypothetical protein
MSTQRAVISLFLISMTIGCAHVVTKPLATIDNYKEVNICERASEATLEQLGYHAYEFNENISEHAIYHYTAKFKAPQKLNGLEIQHEGSIVCKDRKAKVSLKDNTKHSETHTKSIQALLNKHLLEYDVN